MAAHCKECGSSDVDSVGTESDSLYCVCGASDRTCRNDGNFISDTLVTKSLVNGCESKLNGDTHIITYSCGSRTCTASETVYCDDIRTRTCDTRSDSRNVMNCCDLYDNGLCIFRCLFQREYELAEVLDGVDVVVGSRGDSVCAHGYHTCSGNIFSDLSAGKMAADTGLCALTHFDLNSRTCVKVILEYAETSRSYLHDGVGAVLIKVLVKSALTCVVVGSKLCSRTGKRLVSVLGNGTVGHCGEHYRSVKLQIRCHSCINGAVGVLLDSRRLLAEEHLCFHRLSQRVDGRVCYLRSVDKYLIPVNGIILRVAHGGKENSSRSCLTVVFYHQLLGVVCALSESVFVGYYLNSACGTDTYASLAVNALIVVGKHLVKIGVIEMHLIGALTLTGTALYTFIRITDHFKFSRKEIYRHFLLPSSLSSTITGSPPLGDHTFSTSGQIALIAHSSLAI